MKNLIHNIQRLGCLEGYQCRGYDLAKKLADENQQKTGNKTIVTRVLDYADMFHDHRREHYSFDVIEIIEETT